MPKYAAQPAGFDVFAEEALALDQACVGKPFDILGAHAHGRELRFCTYQPAAEAVDVIDPFGQVITPLRPSAHSANVFIGTLMRESAINARDYRLRIRWGDLVEERADPYSFKPMLGDVDLHLINEGQHYQVHRALGSHQVNHEGVEGVRFAVWAPNAKRVSVVGDFNRWDGRKHPMRQRGSSGVWELFIPDLSAGSLYKYEILTQHGVLPLKADPVALQAEAAPGNASVVPEAEPFSWTDDAWLAQRASACLRQQPISIYEVHAFSWRHNSQGRALSWDELAGELIPYVKQLGFTHIEFLPVSAHPFGGSWGYQPVGLFAPLPECGSPRSFAHFVDACHRANIGVIVDWVPAHFPTDPHGLMQFDGSALYEHQDQREGFHQDWNTLIYNLGRNEVRGFLLANALYWLETFHVDALRVDAVASMLYRDYSRAADQWIPNAYGGRENLEAIEFLCHLNSIVQKRVPGAMVIAEESTAWPGVTHGVNDGGLGFSFKWNMGWMHDTLNYMQKDSLYRSYHHSAINFCLSYAFSERFILPLSHDEVVHGKGSMIRKMPGDSSQQFANLRSYYGFMWAHPGKKLLFMGDEIAQWAEWNHNGQLDWATLNNPLHLGVQTLVRDLNRLYCEQPALHSADCDQTGFAWLVADDAVNSVFAFYRSGTTEAMPPVLVVSNFTPERLHHYRIGVPRIGRWREAINTDAECYGGSNTGNGGAVHAHALPSHGQAFSVELTLPPLSTCYFVYDDMLQ